MKKRIEMGIPRRKGFLLLSVAAFAATGRKNVLPGGGCQGRAPRAAQRSKILDSLRPAQIHDPAAAKCRRR
ncbi:MAG TPA: hypothetical protein VLJ18_04685 [Thermoanaerobaculia bacterium]|nr:hypothetical protein [Thermoanaerobaculia bacterium]